ncbi:MAG: hypothetical protein ACPGUV_00555 [Polyangiales bacterium]
MHTLTRNLVLGLLATLSQAPSAWPAAPDQGGASTVIAAQNEGPVLGQRGRVGFTRTDSDACALGCPPDPRIAVGSTVTLSLDNVAPTAPLRIASSDPWVLSTELQTQCSCLGVTRGFGQPQVKTRPVNRHEGCGAREVRECTAVVHITALESGQSTVRLFQATPGASASTRTSTPLDSLSFTVQPAATVPRSAG